ncbi:hypothetical protein Srubr_38580 [Streptomyces rubradiris]|uniref:Uncharacterized protein n=1 Tax=Streptomyces rubradiris TaxID=285531 RepID=A0ABQ3RDT3_STRRR|nr:hypothetical protein Srubr_38580 [Streptomyces rubradiris]
MGLLRHRGGPADDAAGEGVHDEGDIDDSRQAATWVKSVTQVRLGTGATKSRSRRSGVPRSKGQARWTMRGECNECEVPAFSHSFTIDGYFLPQASANFADRSRAAFSVGSVWTGSRSALVPVLAGGVAEGVPQQLHHASVAALLGPGNAGARTRPPTASPPPARPWPSCRRSTGAGDRAWSAPTPRAVPTTAVAWLARRGRWLNCSVGMVVTEAIHQHVLRVPARAWTRAAEADGGIRDGAWVAELTGDVLRG